MTHFTLQGEDLSGLVRKIGPNTIGVGGATDIYLGELSHVGSPPVRVVIKIFRKAHIAEPHEQEVFTRRLIRESNVWRQLDHPNVQPYYGFCRPSEDICASLALISPFCVNGTVLDYLEKNPTLDRLRLISQIAEGLKYLHHDTADLGAVIHGDLSGRNVLIDDNGNARLADFGRAKILGQAEYDTTLFAGSTEYMAPELFDTSVSDDEETEDEEVGDEATEDLKPELAPFSTMSDVYAFSILAFQLLTDLHPLLPRVKKPSHIVLIRLIVAGRRPNRAHDSQKRIPDKMWNLMVKCWVADPLMRPTMIEVINNVSQLL